MNRYCNKSEVLHVLQQGGHIESHDLQHWLVDSNGTYQGKLRYSLWRILTKGRESTIEQVSAERRPPSPVRYFIYKLRPDKYYWSFVFRRI